MRAIQNRLAGCTARSTLRAEPAENELGFADNPFTEGTRGWLWYVVPIHIFNIAAAVADEVVVPHACQIEPAGAALDGHFADQTRLHQISQVVIGRGPGRSGVYAVHGLEDFRSCGMPLVVHQKCHDSVALRCAP